MIIIVMNILCGLLKQSYKHIKYFVLAATIAFLSACGGNGENSHPESGHGRGADVAEYGNRSHQCSAAEAGIVNLLTIWNQHIIHHGKMSDIQTDKRCTMGFCRCSYHCISKAHSMALEV